MGTVPDRSAADSLLFLAPGLAHHLGNALFSAHGRTVLLASGGGDTAVDRSAILGQLEFAQRDLQVLRWLCGDPSPASVGRLLASLQELLRVPLRDRGLALHVRGPAACFAAASGQGLCRLLLAAIRQLAALAVPGPPGAQIDLEWDADEQRVRLWLAMQPAPGQPRLPLDPDSLLELLARDLRAAGGAPGPARHGCLALEVPALGRSPDQA